MKNIIYLKNKILLFPFALIFFSMTLLSVFEELGINEQVAQDYIFNNIDNGLLNFPLSDELKHITKENRANIVNLIGVFIKEFTKTEDFISRFNNSPNLRYPAPSKSQIKKPRTAKERIAELEKDNMQDESALNDPEVPDSFRDGLKENIMKNKELIETIKKAPTEFEKNEQERYNIQSNKYLEELKIYNSRKNFNQFLIIRLNQFLSLTSEIDFDAKLIDKGSISIFENPEYEKKSTEWKLCYRAGKETIAAARTFTENWMKELEQK